MQYYYYYYYEYLLIVDPSDCQSPSTMVDYSLCVMYLFRYYICLSSQQRRCGAPSATSATGSAVMSLQESREATVIYRLSTKEVTAWQWCQVKVCPLCKEKVSPIAEYQRLLEGFSPGQYDTDTESGSLTFLITRIS